MLKMFFEVLKEEYNYSIDLEYSNVCDLRILIYNTHHVLNLSDELKEYRQKLLYLWDSIYGTKTSERIY